MPDIKISGDNLTMRPLDDVLTIKSCDSHAEEVVRITADGKLFWRGREVETDEEFRDCCKVILRKVFNVEHV